MKLNADGVVCAACAQGRPTLRQQDLQLWSTPDTSNKHDALIVVEGMTYDIFPTNLRLLEPSHDHLHPGDH